MGDLTPFVYKAQHHASTRRRFFLPHPFELTVYSGFNTFQSRLANTKKLRWWRNLKAARSVPKGAGQNGLYETHPELAAEGFVEAARLLGGHADRLGNAKLSYCRRPD